MAKYASRGHTHANLLTALGFPPDVVESSTAALESGLFDLEPSPDLVRRTVEACQEALIVKPSASPRSDNVDEVIAAYDAMASDFVDLDPLGNDSPALLSVGRLVSECLATVGFVHRTRKRPMTVLDNHNVVVPRWWSSDTGFIAVRDALKTVNEAAAEVDGSPATVVMVLRPAFDSYEDVDFRSLGRAFSDASDIWLMPYEMAGSCKNLGALVFGNGCAMTLEGKRDTPGATFSAFQEIHGKSAANVRADILSMTARSAAIRHHAEFGTRSNDAPLRAVVQQVIETGEAVRVID